MSMSWVKLCKTMLEQNQLKKGERLVVATPHRYDLEYVSALIDAASELGAEGVHLIPIPKQNGNNLVKGLTQWHWDIYAAADLLITIEYYPWGNPNVPNPGSGYVEKAGTHEYKDDFEFIARAGSKTRWLEMMFPPRLHRQYFPTPEREDLTLKGAELLQKTREIRVTSKAGSDFTCKKVGRPGHAQYGIADAPGRWDNFGFGCTACAPEEYSSEGTLVLEPADIILNFNPDPWVAEQVKVTFKGGYITNIEGGVTARRFSNLLASRGSKESYGLSHIGWGTHEKATIGAGTPEDVMAYHHNAIGSVLVAMGVNWGHGLGGPATKYSGMGNTTRKAPSHDHFTLFNADFYCDGEKVVEQGKLLLK